MQFMKGSKTFAQILAEVKATPTPTPDVRFGVYNHDGVLFDPSGTPLTRTRANISPAVARELVRAGAQLAWEGCGCGGWDGCRPDWIPEATRRRIAAGSKPRFTPRHHAPTWIDEWEGDTGLVVFAHGDIAWGDALEQP